MSHAQQVQRIADRLAGLSAPATTLRAIADDLATIAVELETTEAQWEAWADYLDTLTTYRATSSRAGAYQAATT